MSHNATELAQVFTFAQTHRAELAHAQKFMRSMEQVTQLVAQAIAAAFGANYSMGTVFSDYHRVHIRPKNHQGIDYLVWFGHVVDLTQKPSFSITLYPTTDSPQQHEQLRSLLTEMASRCNSGIRRPGWFSNEEWFDEMIVGKDYFLVGNTIAELTEQVKSAFETDWLPLESYWQHAQDKYAANS